MMKTTKFPTLYFLIIDVFLVALSFIFVGFIFTNHFQFNILSLFIFCVIRALLFVVFNIQKPVVIYSSLSDIKSVFHAVFLGSIIFISLSFFIQQFEFFNHLNWQFFSVEFVLSFCFLTWRRLAINGIYNTSIDRSNKSRNAVIYAAGDSAFMMVETLLNDSQSDINCIAIISDNKQFVGKMIHGIRVVPSSYIATNYKKDAIDLVILTENKSEIKTSNDLLQVCYQLEIDVLELPAFESWLNKPFKQQLKKISIDQLLGRDEIQLSTTKINAFIEGKTVLITGAAGSIGSELVKQIIGFNPSKIVVFDQSETGLYELEFELKTHFKNKLNHLEIIIGDIKNKSRLEEVFKIHQPQLIYHAAAYKHVPLMELNALEAIETNFLGSINLVQLAMNYSVEAFVFISTDKAVNPTNVMGATKRATELYIQAVNQNSATKFVITRFGNVLGSNGSVIPLFEKQIALGGPITITDERITRYFMTIKEATQLVLEACVMGEKSEIFVFDMGQSVKIVDLAKKMIYLNGLKEGKDISIEFIGLRPGEKLYEELLANEESTMPTHHAKILIGKSQNVQEELVYELTENLKKAISNNQKNEAIVWLKKLVPEYKSNNSSYAQFD